MMARLFVLDVAEFEPLIAAAATSGYAVERAGDYAVIDSAGSPLSIQHAQTGMREALWFGSLTGGYEGRLEAFDDHTLRIV
jgi:hypothetical protein